jgi:ABC-type Fe3+/spermidine/putrescine transport system ATPase subunit
MINIALISDIGCGKTTFIKSVAGPTYKPATIFGREIKNDAQSVTIDCGKTEIPVKLWGL